jgi:hypothetical protein
MAESIIVYIIVIGAGVIALTLGIARGFTLKKPRG